MGGWFVQIIIPLSGQSSSSELAELRLSDRAACGKKTLTGGWFLDQVKIRLTQPQVELELRLSLGKINVFISCD